MQKSFIISLLILFASNIFAISYICYNPLAPTRIIFAAGCCILVVVSILQHFKYTIFRLTLSEEIVIGFFILSSIYGESVGRLNPEWIISGISLILFYLLSRRISLNLEWLYAGLVLIGIIQAVYGLGQYLYWFPNIAVPGFRISGSFDNPAGFAATLTVCSPFALFLMQKKAWYWKIIGGLSITLFTVAIVLSQSRAGIISIVFLYGIWISKKEQLKLLTNWYGSTKIAIGIVFIVGLLAGLYFFKKDSADGRLLIWQCSVNMLRDNPLLGHGIGGFQREYMLYQAEYFRSNPDSSFSMLADIVKHPFNEYLFIAVEHGLLGIAILGILFYLLTIEYRKNKSSENNYLMLCLTSIAVIACFSYPLNYPFIRLIAVFCAAIIMRNETVIYEFSHKKLIFLKPLILIIALSTLLVTTKLFYDDFQWNKIAKQSLAGETKKVLPEYERLYKTMNRNSLFLYNYAAELNFIDRNKESNLLFINASHFMNDIDLQLQMADNYQKMKNYKEAETCYKLAHEMIPNRFIPLYRLAQMYKEQGRNIEAQKLAKEIIRKPVKIPSYEISFIKQEMKQFIENNPNKTN